MIIVGLRIQQFHRKVILMHDKEMVSNLGKKYFL